MIAQGVGVVNGRLVGRPAADDLRPDEVEVRALAGSRALPGIRAIAAELALRADQNLDAVGDLRLAVEELCSSMARNADPDQTMTTWLRVTPDRAEIRVDIPLPQRRPVVSPLSLRILRVLCDSVDYWTDDVDDRTFFHAHVVRLVE